MILTCPRCATRYFVGADAVPAGGRTVRCAACGDAWRAEPQVETAFRPEPLELGLAGAAAAGAPALPQAFRAKAEARRRTLEAVTTGAIWAALAAAVLLVLLAMVVFRREVVRLWPRTAGAYAAVHLPVNPTGLGLDTLEGAPGLENGHVVLAVSGLERNVEAQPRAGLPVRVSLFDRAGAVVATRLATVAQGPLGPGDTRPFRAVFPDPPLAAAEYGARFELAPNAARPPVGRAAAPAARRPSSARRLRWAPADASLAPFRGSPHTLEAVPQARPLPAGSPYALPTRD